jgi:murein DD-endopeptidase MepM/ murein hydrolase activator NlpD
VTSCFGPDNPKRPTHQGLDISDSTGTPVYAIQAGVVKEVQHDFPGSAYGNGVYISHTVDGVKYVSDSHHFSRIGTKDGRELREGDTVARGEPIGYVGNTGESTGPHLHINIYKAGVLVNPLCVLPVIPRLKVASGYEVDCPSSYAGGITADKVSC